MTRVHEKCSEEIHSFYNFLEPLLCATFLTYAICLNPHNLMKETVVLLPFGS